MGGMSTGEMAEIGEHLGGARWKPRATETPKTCEDDTSEDS